MKYETPDVTALTPAIDAIQGQGSPKLNTSQSDAPNQNEHGGAYADWE